MLTLKILFTTIFTVLKNCPLRRKASHEVRKITLFFSSHNAHRGWGWGIINFKAKKNHILFFSNQVLFNTFTFQFELQKVGMQQKNNVEGFDT